MPPKFQKVVRFRLHTTKGETKNCYRFEEEQTAGQPPIIGSLYVQKWVFPTRPMTVSVTLEMPE